jgi:hypothetical protein
MVAMIVLRVFWTRVPARLRFFLVRFAFVLVVAELLMTATTWNTVSNFANALINWGAVAGYMLIILLFTRHRPKWLTTISAVILLIPVFASSVLSPLGILFTPTPNRPVRITRNLFFERNVWVEGANSGIDLNLYHRPTFTPFLRKKIERVPFNNQQCHTAESMATLEPDGKNIRVVCPPWPNQNAEAVERIIPLP